MVLNPVYESTKLTNIWFCNLLVTEETSQHASRAYLRTHYCTAAFPSLISSPPPSTGLSPNTIILLYYCTN